MQMKVGMPGKRYKVEVGEPVDVLVLSDNRSLSRFIAVHDIFLPNVGIWLSEQPCIERPVFEGIREGFSSPSMQPSSEVCDKTQSIPVVQIMIVEKDFEQHQFVKIQESKVILIISLGQTGG